MCCQGIRAVNACVRVVRVTAHDLHAVVDKARNGRRRRGNRLLRILGFRGRGLNRGAGLIHVLRAKVERFVRIDHVEVANGQVIVRHNAADNISADHIDLCRAGAGTGGLTELTFFIVLHNDRADLIARHSRCCERYCGDRIAHGLLRRGNPGISVRIEGNVVRLVESAAIGRRKLCAAAIQHAVVHHRVVKVLRNTARYPFRRVRLVSTGHGNRQRRLNILQRIGSIVPAAKVIARIRHARKIRERRSRIGIACSRGSAVRVNQRNARKARNVSQKSAGLARNGVARIAAVRNPRTVSGVKGNRGRCRINRQRRGCHGKYHDSRHRRGDPRLEIMSQSHLIPPQ